MLTQILFLTSVLYLFVLAFKDEQKKAARIALALMVIGWGMAVQTADARTPSALIAALLALSGMLVGSYVLVKVFVRWLRQKLNNTN